MLYTWFPLAILLFFLLLIGRFYQKFSGERTFFRLFSLPMFLFGSGAVRYASINRVMGDTLGDVLIGIGGGALLVLCLALYRRMSMRRGEYAEEP
jgi:hypothetical protein